MRLLNVTLLKSSLLYLIIIPPAQMPLNQSSSPAENPGIICNSINQMYFHELKPECTKSDMKSHLSLSNLKTFYSTVHKLMITPDHKQAIKVTFTDLLITRTTDAQFILSLFNVQLTL